MNFNPFDKSGRYYEVTLYAIELASIAATHVEEKPQTLMLFRMILMKALATHNIDHLEFATPPMFVEVLF